MIGVDDIAAALANLRKSGILIPIHLASVETYLDCGELYASMKSGKWASCSRDGKTIRNVRRFRIPITIGTAKTSISELAFDSFGIADSDLYRHAGDLPRHEKRNKNSKVDPRRRKRAKENE